MQTTTIGLLGGIGWASTAEYYRIINELVAAHAGPQHSARIVLHSMDQFDFTSRAAIEDPAAIVDIIRGLARRGAQGGVLGCTEIPLLIKASDVEMPVFDTTRIHCEAAVARAFD